MYSRPVGREGLDATLKRRECFPKKVYKKLSDLLVKDPHYLTFIATQNSRSILLHFGDNILNGDVVSMTYLFQCPSLFCEKNKKIASQLVS